MASTMYSERRYDGPQPKLFADYQIFADCEFDKVIAEGAQLSDSIFSNCTFRQVDWYWCQAFRSIFVNCKFHDCDMRGNFDEARFISCVFAKCRYDRDNLGGNTEWAGAVSVLCEIQGAPLPIVKSSTT